MLSISLTLYLTNSLSDAGNLGQLCDPKQLCLKMSERIESKRHCKQAAVDTIYRIIKFIISISSARRIKQGQTSADPPVAKLKGTAIS